MASPRADMRELKANSGATVQELQEFLRELRGKSPQEMLGRVATSQLFRSTLLSLILVTLTLLLLTAIPWFLQEEGGNEAAATPEPALAPAPTPPPVAPEPVPEPDLDQPAASLAPLGVNDKKTAPPESNPLEDQGGSFLDDLE